MRRLAIAAAGYTGSLILAHYVLGHDWLPWLALGFFVLGVACIIALRGGRRTVCAIVCLSAAAGFIWTWGFTELRLRPAEKMNGATEKVTVRISDYPEHYDGYDRVRVKITGGEARVSAYVYDYDGALPSLEPGDEAEMTLRFKSAAERFGEKTDANTSQGIFLRAYASGECRVTGRWSLNFLLLPRRLAHEIGEEIAVLWPEDASPFMTALLTGKKTDFYGDERAYSALTGAGMSHVVAVSGMHVAFLVGAVRLITGRRRKTAFICIPLIAVFTAMTGFTPSAVRAAVMQTMLLAAPLLRRENDPLTALGASALVLLLANPISVANVGLQLSFAAMAGITLLAQPVYARLDAVREALAVNIAGRRLMLPRGVVSVIAGSVAAQVFTLPLSALHFGFLPLYSVAANVLCLWAVSAAFVSGYAVCLAGLIFPAAGRVLALGASVLPRYVLSVCSFISRLPYAAFYTRSNYAAWMLVFVYAVFIGAYLLRGRGRMRLAAPICACVIAFCTVTLVMGETPDGGLTVTAVDVGQGQSIAVLQRDSTVVIDCGGFGSGENAGDSMSEYLFSQGRRSVDILMLTHLHADHANGVVRLMSRVPVDRIVMPETADDAAELDDILAAAEDCGARVYYITEDSYISLGSLGLDVYAPIGAGDVNERGLIILGEYGSFEFLVTGDAGTATENRLVSEHSLPDIELLIAGHHGSSHSTGDRLLDAAEPDVAFISVGYNSYGHPSPDTLERLTDHGVEVHRTDEEGNVTITVGDTYG